MRVDVAAPWFRSVPVTDRVSRIFEPHVDGLLQANIWHLRDRDHDLVVDTGLGVASLRRHMPDLFANDPIVVLTHGHLDHVGGAAEFDVVYAHPGDRPDDPAPGTLARSVLLPAFGLSHADEPGPEQLIDALPATDYDPAEYAVRAPRSIRWLSDGDGLELGDRRFEVLHLPGHTPGTIALFEPETGELVTGDCVYDDILLDKLPGSSIADYIASMERLRALTVRIVYPGHGEPFGGDRLREIIDAYLLSRKART